MAHTLPDYTSKWKTSKIADVVDPGEAAVRLGSIDTYDRRGNVAWMDDFEDGIIHWSKQSVTGAASIESYVGHSFMGSTSMKMITNGVGTDSVYVRKYFPILQDSTLGLETRVNTTDEKIRVDIAIWGYTGTHRFQAVVRWLPETNTFQYRNSAAVYVDLSTSVGTADFSTSWMPIKIVVDHSTGYYKRAMIGEHRFDCSTYQMEKTVDATEGHIILQLMITQEEVAQKTAYFDNVILTQNEE